ncbi:MAG TPA: DUF998 domain-containing protein [Xanthomonadaceae bacterium]|nr:DUF998 domain-containing protein [Xanthomonadaceae bacterium]
MFRSRLSWSTLAGLLAGPCCAFALIAFAARVPGYRHAADPPALLGATGMPGASAFNLLGFVLPGLLAAMAAQGLHRALASRGAAFAARVGATLLQLSALAFAAQGAWPLRLGHALDQGPARWHVAAWTLWWLAAVAGLALCALGARSLRGWRAPAVGAALAAGAMLLAAQGLLPIAGGVAARIALAAWFGWIAWAAWCAGLSRGAA